MNLVEVTPQKRKVDMPIVDTPILVHDEHRSLDHPALLEEFGVGDNKGLLNRAIGTAGALLFAVVVIIILYFVISNIYAFWDNPLFKIYSLLVAGYVLTRFSMAAFYRPPQITGFQPTVTVIIAAMNEELSIRKTIDYIYECDYPVNKLQLIAVNDGSTDETLKEMELASLVYAGLDIISFHKNRGKRQAMAEGVKQAGGDILIFVDSDTFLRRDALQKIVRGFSDNSVGAVCGHAFVQNARQTNLTRMQEVRYYVSFRILKGAESILGTVTCCSGCLSAYRKSVVDKVLDKWLNQRFLGAEATFGDDRSLTNHVLRNNRVIYDSEAICSTIAPSTTRVFFRQQLRWKKSWIRESLIASTFLWKRHPLSAFFFYLQILICLVSPLFVTAMLIAPLFGLGRFSLIYAFGVLLVALLYGLFYLIRFRDGLWIYGVIFQFIYSIVLAWQNYYAIITIHRNHWGTR